MKDAGLRLDVEAPSAKAPSMTGALELFLKENMEANPESDDTEAKA